MVHGDNAITVCVQRRLVFTRVTLGCWVYCKRRRKASETNCLHNDIASSVQATTVFLRAQCVCDARPRRTTFSTGKKLLSDAQVRVRRVCRDDVVSYDRGKSYKKKKIITRTFVMCTDVLMTRSERFNCEHAFRKSSGIKSG